MKMRLNIKLLILFTIILAIVYVFSSSSPVYGQKGENVAVLYFTDHSRFDSGGLLSFWPFSAIFGTGKNREKWHLASGFRDMLNEKLVQSGYNIIKADEIDQLLKEIKKENIKILATKLNADIIIIGDIRKFEQHRARASSQGPTKVASGEYMSIGAMGGVGGFYYSSTVNIHIIMYDSSGEEIENSDFNSKKDLQDFYMGVGPATYHKGDTKDEAGKKNPIVDYNKLDNIKFGSDEFKNDTLFGLATMDVMDEIVTRLGEHLSPSEIVSAQGKIIYLGTGDRLKENEVYINLGASDGIKPGIKLGVYMEELKLIDPDSGKELGTAPEEKIGIIKVTRVEADHLSIAEIVESTKKIERGNLVKQAD